MKPMKLFLLAALITSALAGSTLCQRVQAQEEPGILAYGMRGFFTGAELGLSIGYLSTGSSYESGEWRNMIYGLGIGALTGVGVGLVLGITDTASDPPPTGWYVLRDAGYGTLFGGLIGTTVGLLFYVSTERSRDIVTGASYGALIGAAAGITFGIIESSSESHRRRAGAADGGAMLALGLMPNPDSRLPLAGLSGKF